MTKSKLLRVGLLVILIWTFTNLRAQNDSIVDQIYAVLILDSLTITADTHLPDIKTMIRQTINDTTFYRAFQRLRRKSYRFSSELYFYTQDWIPYTYMRSLRDQNIIDGVRTNEIIEEDIHGKMVNRKGDFKFYTAQMYNRIFFTNSPTPVPETLSNTVDVSKNMVSKMDKYINDLKLLIFAPGANINIPLMGDKTSIFTEEQMKNYTYSISPDTTSSGIPVYNFTISANSIYSEKETVIKELKTTFDKQNKQILGRNYTLAYNTLFYSFDVNMNINVTIHDGSYIPTEIKYKGQWSVPLKKSEYCDFSFRILEFHE